MTRYAILILVLALAAVGGCSNGPAFEKTLEIQPIVACDDNGENPAACRLKTKAIKAMYAKAGIDVVFKPAKRYHDIQTRDGLANLDKLSARAKAADMLDSDCINLIFMTAYKGKRGAFGFARMGGNITFISMSPDASNPARDGFVVAHEVGHNLGLRHAVDDPNVPNDVPNIMGDGPFEKRISPELGLTQYQIDLILKSKLFKKQ